LRGVSKAACVFITPYAAQTAKKRKVLSTLNRRNYGQKTALELASDRLLIHQKILSISERFVTSIEDVNDIDLKRRRVTMCSIVVNHLQTLQAEYEQMPGNID
jgi:hypothetical protein